MTAIIAFFTTINRTNRISYKNLLKNLDAMLILSDFWMCYLDCLMW